MGRRVQKEKQESRVSLAVGGGSLELQLLLASTSQEKGFAPCLHLRTEKKKNRGKKNSLGCIFNPPLPQNTTPKRAVIMSLPAAKTVKSQKKAIQK